MNWQYRFIFFFTKKNLKKNTFFFKRVTGSVKPVCYSWGQNGKKENFIGVRIPVPPQGFLKETLKIGQLPMKGGLK